MRDLPALRSLYTELDARLDEERASALRAGDLPRTKQIEGKQCLNDQAYFLICWGQIERTVDDCCRIAIRKHRANAAWPTRRGWDLYNPEDKRLSGLSFEDRAALVLDKQAGRGSPWARLIAYYTVRNQIAHGTLHTDRIDVVQAIADFYAIQGALTS